MNSAATDSYLNVLARVLTRYGMEQDYEPVNPDKYPLLQRALARRGYIVTRRRHYDPQERAEGRDHPPHAETMVGLRRLANIRHCLETVLEDDVPGDFLETGVWRGGASIYAAAVLAAHNATARTVCLADSFEGLPPPDTERYAGKDVVDISGAAYLAVGIDQVRANFGQYQLAGDNIRFIKGWFKDTMPTAPIEHLAVLRLDGDLYSSTMDVLQPMYDKVSVGGFVIVDDYGNVPECRQAITDFRAERGITDEILDIDGSGVYWRRTT